MAKRTKKMANKKGQEKKSVPFTVTARVWTDEELMEAFSHM